MCLVGGSFGRGAGGVGVWGEGIQHSTVIMDDITLEGVQQDCNFNIKDILNNESNSLYSNSNHTCKSYDFDTFKEKTEKLTDSMSILSLNIRSLPNKWSHFEDFVSNVNSTKFKLSVIGLSEIWNIPFNLNFKLPGYKPLVYKIRDSLGVNNNAGGGVGLFVDDNFEFEVLENISIFIPKH